MSAAEDKSEGNAKFGLWLAVAVAVVAVAAFSLMKRVGAPADGGSAAEDASPCRVAPGGAAPTRHGAADAKPSPCDDEEEDDGPDDEEEDDDEEELTEDEKREAEEERRVDAFDDLTDKWMEPAEKGVTMDDVDRFAKFFSEVPEERRDECIHRALNLIPDENVMLLAGILMDKTLDREIVETVFNDILNRDEEVKALILRRIFKDKSHPCWADTAWILDVTDDLPGSDTEED